MGGVAFSKGDLMSDDFWGGFDFAFALFVGVPLFWGIGKWAYGVMRYGRWF